MNFFILKDWFRNIKRRDTLEYDHKLFLHLKENQVVSQEYWRDYTILIESIIEKSKLTKFGLSYNLTRGFGEAMAYPWEREKKPFHKNFAGTSRLRKLIKIDPIYFLLRKIQIDWHQSKQRANAFKFNEHLFSELGYINLTKKIISRVTKRLGINKYFKVHNVDILQKYMQSFVYIELLKNVIKENKIETSIEEIFNGNLIDIGGGFGAITDAYSIFKKSKNIGNGSTNYLLDQYPVSFIANQYLKYRHQDQLLSPLYENDLSAKLEEINPNKQNFRIIQNNLNTKISNLNIKFFFNSNSFQEMDKSQIEEYADFIKRNKAENAILACFCYLDIVEKNNYEKVISVFNKYFEFIGFSEFGFDRLKKGGFIAGRMYLFNL